MSRPAIRIKGIGKKYRISHELMAQAGTGTIRDAMMRVARKPLELFTGHIMKKEEFWALKNVSFDVQPGDVVGIIGRNGSGKSTLLKVLSRIAEPTTGEAVMNGRVASLLEVGTGFHPELTGRENVYFNGAILGMRRKEIERKFDEIVAFSEVEKFLDTPVKFYSSGMYVRLAFAVAAHLDPDILIVDEVLAVGDVAFQKKCLGKMKSVAGQGRTVLFVSHNMESVQKLCRKCVFMKSGELIEYGPTSKIISRYEKEMDGSRGSIEIEQTDENVSINKASVMVGEKVAPEVQFGTTPDVEIDLTINAKTENLILSIGLSTGGGLPIRTLWSDELSLKEGRYRVQVALDNMQLAVGNYQLQITSSIKGQVLQNIDNQLGFSVQKTSKQVIGTIQDYGQGSGVLKNQTRFNIKAIAK